MNQHFPSSMSYLVMHIIAWHKTLSVIKLCVLTAQFLHHRDRLTVLSDIGLLIAADDKDTLLALLDPVGETQLCCAWSQDLKPTINGPPITRIVARFTHAPAQDSHVPALGSAGCSCGCRVPSSGAVVTVVTVQRVRRDYKYPDSTHELTNIM